MDLDNRNNFKTVRKLIDLKQITLDTFSAYAKLKNPKATSKPLIESFLNDIAVQIRRKHPNLLKNKPIKVDKFNPKLS